MGLLQVPPHNDPLHRLPLRLLLLGPQPRLNTCLLQVAVELFPLRALEAMSAAVAAVAAVLGVRTARWWPVGLGHLLSILGQECPHHHHSGVEMQILMTCRPEWMP